ncbi:MAG: hypothetical protein ACXW5U_18500 [Thermoanaerobaculia bacterium]
MAVLTATLLSLIWYTYFTYRAVNNEPPTMVDIGFGYQRSPASMSFSVQNQRHHHLECTIGVRILAVSGDHQLPPPYGGRDADRFILKPGEAFHGSLPVGELVESLPLHRRTVLVTATAVWQDETGDTGTAGPKSWLVDLENQSMRRLYSRSEVDHEGARIVQGFPVTTPN